ncbi:MAG: mechanosensitive ion channel domain-containing protein [Chloroflexota bacterium]
MDTSTLQKLIEANLSTFLTVTLPGILRAVFGSLAVLIVGIYALRIVTRVAIAGARRSHVKQAQIDLLAAGVTGAGWILIMAGILQALNLNELAIAVGGSISLVALGIATAASGNLGDIIAGVFLASDPDFGSGFVIKTGDISGTIERIDLRKTRIRAEDGKLHVVPNKAIESTVWIVQQRPVVPPPQPRASRPRLNIGLGGHRPGEEPSKSS